jgi:predicted DNA-binding WGR domain protein
MNRIYLERHDPGKNMHRFYQIDVTPGIFGDWSLVKEWGRVGSPGTVRSEWFDTEDKAVAAGKRLRDSKRKKGYHSKTNDVR